MLQLFSEQLVFKINSLLHIRPSPAIKENKHITQFHTFVIEDVAPIIQKCSDILSMLIAGDRPNVPNVAIIVTDGQSNNAALTASEAKKARDAGITVLAIGVGHGVKTTELNAMATDPDNTHVYTADNFDALNSLQALLSTKACEG